MQPPFIVLCMWGTLLNNFVREGTLDFLVLKETFPDSGVRRKDPLLLSLAQVSGNVDGIEIQYRIIHAYPMIIDAGRTLIDKDACIGRAPVVPRNSFV